MAITRIVPQLRTTDIASSIRFYTEKLGFSVDFNYQDFYVGIRAGSQLVHLKLVDKKDPSIPYVDEGGHIHLYIEITGVTAFAAQLRASGVPLYMRHLGAREKSSFMTTRGTPCILVSRCSC